MLGETLGLLEGLAVFDGDALAVTVGDDVVGGAVTTVLGDCVGFAVGVVPWFFTKMLMTPAARTPAIAKARSLWPLLMADPPHESQQCDSIV